MENLRIYYIVYDISTLKIVDTSSTYNVRIHNMQKIRGNSYLNVTHPNSKDILNKINEVNKTDYK
jgi:hypothetical protein